MNQSNDPQTSRILQLVLQQVAVFMGKWKEEIKQEVLKEIRSLEDRLDQKSETRQREAANNFMGIQQRAPEKQKNLTGSTVPSAGLGGNGDVYRQVNGSNQITAFYEKVDGQWIQRGTYEATERGTARACFPAQTDYGTLELGTGSAITLPIAASTTLQVPEEQYNAGTLTVHWQGQTLMQGYGLTETNPAAGEFQLTPQIDSGQQIYAEYVTSA